MRASACGGCLEKPKSSCPFKSAQQKNFGLGYSLLIFVYEKIDNHSEQTGCLNIRHTIFVNKKRSADFQTTSGIVSIIENDGNIDDLLTFFSERMLPVDEIEAERIANQVLTAPPIIGYLTISNALQWRLKYRRVIEKAGNIDGIQRVF